MNEKLLGIQEAAEALRVAPATLRYWRSKGTGPKSFKVGGSIVYRASDLDAYLAEQYGSTLVGSGVQR